MRAASPAASSSAPPPPAVPKEDIVSDLEAFHTIWTEIRQRTESSRAPAVVYREQSLVGKLLRDLLTDEFQAIRIDNAAGIISARWSWSSASCRTWRRR